MADLLLAVLNLTIETLGSPGSPQSQGCPCSYYLASRREPTQKKVQKGTLTLSPKRIREPRNDCEDVNKLIIIL